MLFDSFIRSPLVGAAVFVAFKTAVPFLCTAVGKQICSFDSPLLEAEPPRFLGFKLSNFSPLCEFSTYFSSSSISPETTVSAIIFSSI